MDQNNPQINQQMNPQPQPTLNETNLPNGNEERLREEKKNLSRKRIFWAICGIDIALLAFLLYEIISLFF